MDNIILSQNDYGIEFEVTLLNNKKESLMLNNKEVIFYVVTPSSEKIEITNVNIVDDINGIVSIVLNQEHTKEEGNYSLYVRIVADNYTSTSTIPFNYYVMAETGGA